jgi:hypothetical protein
VEKVCADTAIAVVAQNTETTKPIFAKPSFLITQSSPLFADAKAPCDFKIDAFVPSLLDVPTNQVPLDTAAETGRARSVKRHQGYGETKSRHSRPVQNACQ